MESRRIVSEDNQVNSHPSSSSNAVVVSSMPAAMEPPPADGSPSATSSRIPSHVFAPTSTTSPVEWSVASNESLFSIHMGNTSFNDRLSWMSKSGELDSTIISSPLFEFPINTPTAKSTENSKKSGNLKNDDGDEDGYGTVNAAAAETMREVLREKESQQKNNIAKDPNLCRSISQLSDTSVKSFAFPILTAEADKSDTVKKGAKNKKQPSSRPSTASTTPQHTPPETPKPPLSPETPKRETPKSPTPKANQNGGPRRWFSCFPCFPSCS